MFAEVGPLGLITVAVLAFLLFGPERLPEAVRKVLGLLRAVREYSDSAKEQIRSELGPDFKDFEFEDLNPRALVRKHLREGDRLGLDEIRGALDPRAEVAEITGVVRDAADGGASATSPAPGVTLTKSGPAGAEGEPAGVSARPPFDPDAT
ncbi:Sec-independent protein translocase subunit TatB [Streptomyces sp. NPDC048639]|uniref:Sec-independent protein translocase subunit TatB n=1 Tax=Streptomyces sp. NPDC048639 TaxID=3365581 RepID=UPI0037197A6D